VSISLLSRSTQQVLKHPAAFALQTLKSFSDNQGLLLAAAIAYYALLSVVPLLILSVIVHSHLVYGPLATAVVALFSMEIVATVVLLGSQV